MSCGLQSAQIFSFSFALSGCLCGQAGMATGSSLLPLPFLPSSFSSLTHLKLFTHSVTHSSAPVTPPPTFPTFKPHGSISPRQALPVSVAMHGLKRKKEKKKIPFKLYPSTPAPPVFCLSVSIARGGCPPMHHNSLGAEVRRGVLRCE